MASANSQNAWQARAPRMVAGPPYIKDGNTDGLGGLMAICIDDERRIMR
jgi:hypothetical protein